MRLLTTLDRWPVRKDSRSAKDPSPAPKNNDLLHPPPAPYARQLSVAASTVSEGTGLKIQKHLDEGKPIYIGVQEECLNKAVRHNAPRPASDDGSETTGSELSSRRERRRRLQKKLFCGLSLDTMAKLTFCASFFLAGYQALTGSNSFIRMRSNSDDKLPSFLAISQVVWGLLFALSSCFGMSVMWGKWRRSPTAALTFIFVWLFTCLFILIFIGVSFYYFHSTRSSRIDGCRGLSVRAGEDEFSKKAPLRSAPQERINDCIKRAINGTVWILIWGIAYIFILFLAAVTAIWSFDYRRRLLEVYEFERLEAEMASEKVGLVIGTAPLGMRSRGTLGPTKAESMASASNNSRRTSTSSSDYTESMSEEHMYSPVSPLTVRNTIISTSGVVISAPNSEYYASPPSQLKEQGNRYFGSASPTIGKVL